MGAAGQELAEGAVFNGQTVLNASPLNDFSTPEREEEGMEGGLGEVVAALIDREQSRPTIDRSLSND